MGLDESEFTKSVIVFILYFITLYIAPVNSVVVTVLYLLRALHRRILLYGILLSKIQRIRASLATANYDNKLSDCLLCRSQRLIELYVSVQFVVTDVFLDVDCFGEVDHAITVVGYGKKRRMDVWIIKNRRVPH